MNPRSRHALAGATACAVTFAALMAAAYWWPRFGQLDAAALGGFVGVDRLHGICADLVKFGDPLPLVLLTAGVCAAGIAWGRRRHVAAALLLVAGANLTAQLLKVALAHPRVNQLLGPSDQPAAAAFPSGHATAAMSIALAAVLVAPRSWRPAVALAGAALSISVSISVIVLGWHFPSDAVGGCILAAGFGLLALSWLRAGESADLAQPETGTRPVPAFSPRLAEILLALGAAVCFALAVAHLPRVLAYARADTSTVAAGLAIVAASAALVAVVAAEAGRR
jgi:membrane-associated phospholipid phosphatase